MATLIAQSKPAVKSGYDGGRVQTHARSFDAAKNTSSLTNYLAGMFELMIHPCTSHVNTARLDTFAKVFQFLPLPVVRIQPSDYFHQLPLFSQSLAQGTIWSPTQVLEAFRQHQVAPTRRPSRCSHVGTSYFPSANSSLELHCFGQTC